MTMRDEKRGPIGDKFKEIGTTIKGKLERNKISQALKQEAKDMGFRKSEARDIAKRYRKNKLTDFELSEIGKKFMTEIPESPKKSSTKLSVGDAAAISNYSNQDEFGRSKAEQVYDAKQGITPKPLNTMPLDNPVAKGSTKKKD